MSSTDPAPTTVQMDDTVRALRESEARLQQVLDNTTAAVFAKDSKGRYLFVNHEFERLVDRAAGEVVGRTDRELFPPEMASRFRHNDLRVLLERRAIEFEENVPYLGEQRTYLASKFPLFDSEGVPYAIGGVATDITERKRIEDALSSAALAVSTAKGETLFVELARYLATILGVECTLVAALEEGETRMMNMLALYIDGEVQECFPYPLAGTACETVVGHGFKIYPAGVAELFPLDEDFQRLGVDSYAGYPLEGADGKALGVIAVLSRRPLHRRTFIESVLKIFAVRASAELERMRSEAALRASETSYRGIFEASDDAIFVHDWDTGGIVDANSTACERYGYTHEEMLHISIDDVSSGVPPYNGEGARRMIEEAKRHGSARCEWHRRNRDGSLHWDEVNLKSATIGGQPRVLCFAREITARKEAEEQRERLEAQLRQAQKMEAIGQLTGGIAHDFNNLLTSIMGYIVLATERQAAQVNDARLAGYLHQAHESCERARRLIEQMLMFSRGQRGAPRPLALAQHVERMLDVLRPQLAEGVRLVTNLDHDGPAVHLDPVQLEQVVMNLAVNARDVLGGRGTIEIAVRSAPVSAVCASCRQAVEGPYVELSVADDGPGISPEVLERIFEPFFSTKEVGKGAGMGLATLHGVVHEHDGHVLVDTAPGRGACFRVLFPPLSRNDPAAVTAPAVLEPSARPPALRGNVLVVDDEQTVGEFMRELLETWGLDATFVGRPQEAFDIVAERPARFDLVITDQAMPRMTGLELARALRSVRPDLPVVLYTGFGDQVSASDLRDAGVRALLGKPVQPQKLAAVLHEALGAR